MIRVAAVGDLHAGSDCTGVLPAGLADKQRYRVFVFGERGAALGDR